MTHNNGCDTCTETGRKGYCAPARCYCGHTSCYAADSYVDLSTIAAPDPPDKPAPKARRKTTWDNREEPTWLDKL